MPIPTTTSIKADPAEADVGEKISFTGLVRTVDGEPVQNASVYIETAINRKIWTLLLGYEQTATAPTSPM